MKRRSFLAYGLVVLGAFSATAAWADFKATLIKPDTIVVGTTGSAPPTSMIDASGNLAGYDVDLMKKIATDLGVKVEFVQLDWAGLLPGLAAHRFDVVASGVTRTAERLKSNAFIMLSPYIINGVAVTKLASNGTISGWTDVCGKQMGGVRGANEPKTLVETLPPNCIKGLTEYPGWTELALDLKNGRIDFIGMDYLGPSYAASQDKALMVIPDVRAPKTQSIAVAAGEPELAKAMDQLIAKYRDEGTLGPMIEHWFGQKVDFSKMPPDPKM